MTCIMCVDADMDLEERQVVSEDDAKRSVLEVLESEISEADGDVKWLELEELGVDDVTLSSLDLPSKCPGLIVLSLCGNKIDNVEVLIEEVSKLKNLRALWVDNNPVVENRGNDLGDRILRGLPNLEIHNSKFTANFGEWVLGFCGGVFDKENPGSFELPDCPLQQVTDLDLSDRCIQNSINKAFTPFQLPCLTYLNLRGNPLDETSLSDLLYVLRSFHHYSLWRWIFLALLEKVLQKFLALFDSLVPRTLYIGVIGLVFRAMRDSKVEKHSP